MGTKIIYMCDNCGHEDEFPEKWFQTSPFEFETEVKAGIAIYTFDKADVKIKKVKSFCGEYCALHYISTQLSKLHKEENIPVNQPLTYSENLKDFLNGT